MNPIDGIGHHFIDVVIALTPLIIFFILFQVVFIRLPRERVYRLAVGLVLTTIGLTLFLQGVTYALIPVGNAIGGILATHLLPTVLLIGFILGSVATYAEPAVRVLNHQIEDATSGSIPRAIMLSTISIAVGISVALTFLRIIYGINLWWFIIPGYALAFILMLFSTSIFKAIAFDAGGVATGPMTVTFVFALCVGLASTIPGRDPLTDGFGLIALVALAPILSILTLGIVSRVKRWN